MQAAGQADTTMVRPIPNYFNAPFQRCVCVRVRVYIHAYAYT